MLKRDRSWPWTAAVLLAVLVPILAVWTIKANRRFLALDELEHLNGAYFISQGETLYGSVFENHGPLTPWLLQPAVRSSDEPEAIIHRARFLMWALSMCTLAAVASLARRVAGPVLWLFAPTLLLAHTFFFQRGLEVRPDVPAQLCLILAVVALQRAVATPQRRWAWVAGALLGLAGLATPKAIYAAAGATLAACYVTGRQSPGRRLSSSVATLARILAGAAPVVGLALAAIASQGHLGGFYADFVQANLAMRIDDTELYRWSLLSSTATLNTVFWLLAAAGSAVIFRRRRELPPGFAEILLGTSAAGFAGVFHVQSPLAQFYLTFLPALAVAGAAGGAALVDWASRRGSPWMGAAALAAVLVAATAPPIWSLRFQLGTMVSQVNIIREVRGLVGPDERVFDCWSGLYLTRLPAYRYFFLPSDVQRLLGPERLERDLRPVLENRRVKVVIVDRRSFEQLPPRILQLVEDRFTLFAQHHSGVSVLVRK
jgi:hypothetical protein